MSVSRMALAAGLAAALGACAPRPAPQPAPPPAPEPPAPRPAPAPPPSPAAAPGWQDAPLSPGDWSYDSATATAAFGAPGQPSFVLRCAGGGQMTLERRGAAPATAGMLTIRTSSAARTLPARSTPEGLAATLPASDPLLDAIVFSRGRFAVEAGMMPALVVPAWPEAARAIEDCRS
jgi:hypothetical protein